MLEVSPATSPSDAAAQVAQSPAGSKGLVLSGFGEDITSYDRVKLPGSRLTYQSPWLDVGIARTRNRVKAWLDAFKRAGGSADLVMVKPPASLDATQFSALTIGGAKAIAADRRAPSLASEMMVSSVMDAAMAGRKGAWVSGMRVRGDKAIEAAMVGPVVSQLSGAIVICPDRGILPERVAAAINVTARSGSSVGNADCFSIAVPVTGTAGFDAVRHGVTRFRSVAAAATRAYALLVPTKSAFDAATLTGQPPTSSAPDYWGEEVIHASMTKATDVIISPQRLGAADAAAHAALLERLRPLAELSVLEPIQLAPPKETDEVIASGMRAGSHEIWRITLRPGVNSANIRLSDGGVATVRPVPGELGAWLVASSPALPSLNADRTGVEIAPAPASGSGQFVLLKDGAPTASFTSPVTYDSNYLIVYQNNADTQAMVTGVINAERVIAEIRRLQASGVRSTWGVLDFETPFDEILMRGPSDPRYAATTASLVGTITAVKAAFPAIKWTYYGFPHIPYHPAAGDWGRVAPSSRDAVMRQYTDPYAAVLDSMDWFMPCAYDVYSKAKGMPRSPSPADVAESEFRRARVESIVRHFARSNRPVPPIIPAVSPWFQPGAGEGAATWLAPIPSEEFVADQLRPCIAAGARGFAIWGSMDYFLRIAALQTAPQANGVQQLRAQFRAALDAAYPQASSMMQASPATGINWEDAAAIRAVGGQMDATLSDALAAADRLAAEMGLLAPARGSSTTSRN